MSGLVLGVLGFVVLLLMLAVRIPIAIAMTAVGMVGYIILNDVDTLLNFLKTEMFWRFTTYQLSVAPLFILMGNFAAKAGLSQALFSAANAWLGHRRGGVAMAAVGGCAGFAAISGSSLATAAPMGQVALPELRRFNYSGSLATGCLAAGGTLGILIPPSVILIIYAVLVEGSIAGLFQAAFVPGILAAIGYITVIAIVVRVDPKAGPAGERQSRAVRWRALLDIWPVLLVFLLVMGGIYIGFFTPTEGAGVGAAGTFLIAVTKGGMRWRGFSDAVISTANTTAMIFMILFGAGIFNAFLGFSQLPLKAAEFFQNVGLAPLTLVITMVLIYILLGFVMDSLSMILLTTPIFWPIVAGLDFGMPVDDVKLWFGVLTLMVVEMGLITPPVGLNVFIINSMARDVPMIETFKGVMPFFASDTIRVTAVLLITPLTLWLPHLVSG
jgi:C4-dicarboxylate transporter DctM subunit